MRFEEHPDYLVFRECTIAKEGVQPYPDGKIVKTAEELSNADKKAQQKLPVMMFYDGHSKTRLVGFALPPKGIASFQNGKIKRDIFLDKEVLTEDELKGLRFAPLYSKKDVSIGFTDQTDYSMKNWNGLTVDGFSKNMEIDHLSWEERGRCSTEDGCGLTRTDTFIMRHDSIMELNREDADYDQECVSRKIKIFMNEGYESDKAKAAAINYCREKNKKHDSITDQTDKEKVFLETKTEQPIETKPEDAREDKSDLILEKLNSLEELFTQQFKTDSIRQDSEKDCECEDKERKDKESESESESIGEKILQRLDKLEKLNDELKTRIDTLPLPKIRRSVSADELNKKEDNK